MTHHPRYRLEFNVSIENLDNGAQLVKINGECLGTRAGFLTYDAAEHYAVWNLRRSLREQRAQFVPPKARRP